jgi:hypothetical protein
LPPPRNVGHRTLPVEPMPKAPEPDLEFEDVPASVWTPTPVKPPRARKAWNSADAREIQRVAVRLGAVPAGHDPQRTLDILWDLAAEHAEDPDRRLQLYREVAAHICKPEAPACVRCPLRDHCQHHEALRQERHKSRGAFRRLWGA